jgi:hypothetical protein
MPIETAIPCLRESRRIETEMEIRIEKENGIDF